MPVSGIGGVAAEEDEATAHGGQGTAGVHEGRFGGKG